MSEKKSTRERIADILYWPVRIGTIAVVLLMFFPAFNPSKVTLLINKNLSFFTSAVSKSGLLQDVGTNIRKGVVSESTFNLIMIVSIIGIVGILIMAAGGCMSLGNIKLKKRGALFTIGGSVVLLGSMFGIYSAYNQFVDSVQTYDATSGKSAKWDKVLPSIPYGFWVFTIIAIVVLVIMVVVLLYLPKTSPYEKFEMETKYKLFLIMLPFIVLCIVFSYLPLWGWRYSFFNYKSGVTLSMDNFVGFKWFTWMFQDAATRKDVVNVLRNTFIMSGLGIATSWVPMAFAIFLNEIKCKWFRKIVQVFTTIPNFVSWVMVYSIAFAIFSTDGFINSLTGGSTNYLMNESGTWFKMLAWGMWKSVGWSAIIYIAGITGIDPQLYEAATVDGAGRFQKMWHVTVPGLLPTFCVLLLMSVANILSNGMDQYLVFRNSRNADVITVLDLYVYKLGLEDTDTVPLSTVISMTKSIVSVVLLFVANGVSKLIRGESIM